MRALLLGLIGVVLGVAAWGCSANEAGDAGPTSDKFGAGDLRIDPPLGAQSDKALDQGTGASNTGQATTAPTSSVGATETNNAPKCSYPSLGDIHLSLPSARPLAAAAHARGFIDLGRAPDPAIVHPNEFLNYYPPAYAGSANVTVSSGVAPGDLPGEIVLQIGVAAPSGARHRPLTLAIVVDTSLSMAGEGIARARAGAKALASALTPGDRFMLFTSSMSGAPPIVAIGTDGDVGKAVSATASLEADGGDLLGAALAEAYLAVHQEGGLGRVVLITDGAARADQVDLGIVAGNYQIAEIPLIGVGVGDATTYETELVDIATRIGGGASIYLDNAGEAAKILGGRFDEIMDIGAREVQVTLTLPAWLRIKDAQTAADFAGSPTGLSRSDLPLGRALVFRQVLEACEDVALLPSTTIGVDVKWRPREGGEFVPEQDASVTFDGPGLVASPVAPPIIKASLVHAYAEALANVRIAQLADVAKRIGDIKADLAAPIGLRKDADLDEIQKLAQKLVAAANTP